MGVQLSGYAKSYSRPDLGYRGERNCFCFVLLPSPVPVQSVNHELDAEGEE
jgi:hypothetical protein